MRVHLSFTNDWLSKEETDRFIGLNIGVESEYDEMYDHYVVSATKPIALDTMEALSDLITKIGTSCIIGNSREDGEMFLEVYNDYRE